MNEQNAGSIVASPNGMLPGEAEEPPGSRQLTRSLSALSLGLVAAATKRHPAWKDVPDAQWNDWRWQRGHAIKTADELASLLSLPLEEVAALKSLESKYRTAIPPYYFSLIDVNDPHDPIRLQSVPSSKEDANHSGVEFDDPLEEDLDSPVPGVTHRYPDRALLITTPVCSMYCRFCTRKRVTMDRDGWDAPSHDEQRMIEYVRQATSIRDVILSGGDPLTLPVAKLRWFLTELAAIDHVDVIRVGTRVPVTLPQRLFDHELVELLQSAGKVWIQTHFNHPVEITPEATLACRNLVNAGMPVNNHTVLMKGVNDSIETMRTLMRGLLKIKVRPYYLFHCDPVTGAGHFRTSIWKGIEIIEGLRGHVSGLGVPTYVVDGLHGAGKIPIMPNYLLSSSDDAVVLRNYEGMIFRYTPEDKPAAAPKAQSAGVSEVLSGAGKPLVPADNPRHQRRKKTLRATTTTPAPQLQKTLPASKSQTNGSSTASRAKNPSHNGSNGEKVARAATAGAKFDSSPATGVLLEEPATATTAKSAAKAALRTGKKS
jgi:lysine 2,3-aminomutase